MTLLLEGFFIGLAFLLLLKQAGINIISNISELISFKNMQLFQFVFTSLITTITLLIIYSFFILHDFSLFALDVKIIKFYYFNSLAGGIVFGLSWAYLKMCPMTCFITSENQIKSVFTVTGMFLGVICFHYFQSKMENSFHYGFATLPGLLNIKISTVYIFTFLLLFLFLFKNRNKNLVKNWLYPGLAIGSIVFYGLITHKFIGISSSLYASYLFIERLLLYRTIENIPENIIWKFGFSLALFTYFIYQVKLISLLQNIRTSKIELNKSLLFIVTGAGLTFGGLLAGGCTTGAILSGLPTLSLMSLCTSFTIFLTAHLASRVFR